MSLGCEVGEASPVSGKGNKGPLCPVEVGPCCHGHQQVHRQEHVRVGKKWEGGGPGVSMVGSSCDGQEEARLLIYLFI